MSGEREREGERGRHGDSHYVVKEAIKYMRHTRKLKTTVFSS